MSRPFSELVADESWRREAEAWTAEQLGREGRRITGPVEQPRIRPWSTQLIVPTDAGRVWFKANCPGNAFEARLQEVLAELVPDDVDPPLAIDLARGWMLTADHGPSLGDDREATEADWVAVATETARVQRALVDQKASLLAAGLPDYAPPSVPERLDRLIERLSDLPPDRPSHVTAELARKLDRVRPVVAEASEQLERSSIPTTFQHGDIHPRNMWAAGDRLRLFDFGDAQWAFALEALCVPFGWIADQNVVSWTRVRDAYREHWTDLVDHREFEALWHA
ncbi:MAG: phosphotransferase, partial [Pseudolysinimonas sp.]